MRFAAILAAALLASTAFGQTTGEKENPGSLYKSGSQNPYVDRVARKVGDVLTVVVSERSVSNFAAATQANKQDETSFSFSFVESILSRLFRPLRATAESAVSGDGRTTYSGNMSTRMSVLVTQVLPNGNLVIEGRRTLVTNRETQTFVLRGTVRPFDIRPDNTIQSSQIADADIRLGGKGTVQDRQRKGIITSLLDIFF